MLRAAGRCPTADRTLRARNSRMELAELVLCEPRAAVSFIKHLFIFGLFQCAKGWVSRPLPMQIRIGGRGRLLLRAFETRRHTTLLSERGAFTDGICDASLTLESQADLTGQIISPRKSILLTFFRLKHMPDSIHVRLNRKL